MNRKEKATWVEKEGNYDNQELIGKLLNDLEKINKKEFPNTTERVNKLFKYALNQNTNKDKIKLLSNIPDPTIKVWLKHYLKGGINELKRTENNNLKRKRPASKGPVKKRLYKP